MAIAALGYLGIGTRDVAAWRRFAADILGVGVSDHPGGGLRLRYDELAWRIAIEPADTPDVIFAGWEAQGSEAFAEICARITAAGTELIRGDGALAADRGVEDIAVFTDPAGLRCEIYWGSRAPCGETFVSPAGVSGFVTGSQGMGHFAVATPDPGAAAAFYRDVLGFRLSDFIDLPMGPEMILPITFLHCNPRHHSIAFAPAPLPHRLIHAMIQARSIDDVGRAWDRVQKAGIPVSITLGRHSNDHMFSFYCLSPDGLEIEFGADARVIDDADWLPRRYDRISLWGHEMTIHAGPPA